MQSVSTSDSTIRANPSFRPTTARVGQLSVLTGLNEDPIAVFDRRVARDEQPRTVVEAGWHSRVRRPAWIQKSWVVICMRTRPPVQVRGARVGPVTRQLAETKGQFKATP